MGEILDVCLRAVEATMTATSQPPGTSQNNDDADLKLNAVKNHVEDLLRNVVRIPRFQTVILFLSEEEKQIGHRLEELLSDNFWKKI